MKFNVIKINEISCIDCHDFDVNALSSEYYFLVKNKQNEISWEKHKNKPPKKSKKLEIQSDEKYGIISIPKYNFISLSEDLMKTVKKIKQRYDHDSMVYVQNIINEIQSDKKAFIQKYISKLNVSGYAYIYNEDEICYDLIYNSILYNIPICPKFGIVVFKDNKSHDLLKDIIFDQTIFI